MRPGPSSGLSDRPNGPCGDEPPRRGRSPPRALREQPGANVFANAHPPAGSNATFEAQRMAENIQAIAADARKSNSLSSPPTQLGKAVSARVKNRVATGFATSVAIRSRRVTEVTQATCHDARSLAATRLEPLVPCWRPPSPQQSEPIAGKSFRSATSDSYVASRQRPTRRSNLIHGARPCRCVC
jgi:hypothetical protein